MALRETGFIQFEADRSGLRPPQRQQSICNGPVITVTGDHAQLARSGLDHFRRRAGGRAVTVTPAATAVARERAGVAGLHALRRASHIPWRGHLIEPENPPGVELV